MRHAPLLAWVVALLLFPATAAAESEDEADDERPDRDSKKGGKKVKEAPAAKAAASQTNADSSPVKGDNDKKASKPPKDEKNDKKPKKDEENGKKESNKERDDRKHVDARPSEKPSEPGKGADPHGSEERTPQPRPHELPPRIPPDAGPAPEAAPVAAPAVTIANPGMAPDAEAASASRQSSSTATTNHSQEAPRAASDVESASSGSPASREPADNQSKGSEAPSSPATETPASPEPPAPTASSPIMVGSGAGAGYAESPSRWESFRTSVRSLLNGSQPSSSSIPVSGASVPGGGPWIVWALGAVFGVGIGVGAAARLARRTPSRPSVGSVSVPTVSDSATVPDLLARVQEVPHDALACFRLAVLLLQAGAEKDGLRYLDRSFHLDPSYILRLLKDDDCAGLRQKASVRDLLWRVKRDQDHRAWSGYA